MRAPEEVQAPDRDLVISARRGDRSALSALIARHRSLLLALCRRTLPDPGLAEEAAQEAVLQALLNLDRLRDPDRFGPWLAGIGLNVARRWLRDRSREAWSWEALLGGERLREPISLEPSPESQAEVADLVERVGQAVRALPGGQRDAVVLCYFDGLTQEEVAAVLGIRVGSVKTRLHKARTSLRERLWSVWKEEEMASEQGIQFVEMRVADVRRAPAEGETRERFVVLLEEVNGDRGLPIWIGPFEGRGMALLLERLELPRPVTFQFAARVLEAAGGRLRDVRVNRLIGDTFYAEAEVEGTSGTATVDARPSDALSLALLTGASIRVSREVLDAANAKDSLQGFEKAREKYADGAAEIAKATKEEWERSLEEWRRARSSTP
jgi:RNA polymerase sigma-70 factor (ECF subfamily)